MREDGLAARCWMTVCLGVFEPRARRDLRPLCCRPHGHFDLSFKTPDL